MTINVKLVFPALFNNHVHKHNSQISGKLEFSKNIKMSGTCGGHLRKLGDLITSTD